MGTIPGVLRALLSPGAVLFQREVHNFQTEINECLSAPWVLQSQLRVSFDLCDELAISSVLPPHVVLGDSNCLGVSRVLPVLS